jgi:hypothetical protein
VTESGGADTFTPFRSISNAQIVKSATANIGSVIGTVQYTPTTSGLYLASMHSFGSSANPNPTYSSDCLLVGQTGIAPQSISGNASVLAYALYYFSANDISNGKKITTTNNGNGYNGCSTIIYKLS